jgi:hypothetical protein
LKTFVILRRSAWADATELGLAADKSTQVGNEEMPDDVRWIRSYVLAETDGRLGTACVYQATSEDAVREHAERAGLACDEVIAVADTVIVRDDP